VSWGGGEDIVCGARFHSVECITLLSSTEPRKSAMDSKGIRRLYLLLRPKGRLSPGRKTPPGVSAPSTGLRPLNVSRVKCGAYLVEATQRFHVREIRYAFNVRFKRIAEDLISACRKHVVAATGPSPFKVGDNQRPERTMSGVRKPSLESSVPGENLARGSRRNQFWRGHGSPSVLNEVSHEFSTAMRFDKCKRSP
jgi:hypothetical protein